MSYLLSFLFPWLLLVWLFQLLVRRPWSWRALLGVAVASLVVVLIPVREIPLGRWLVGLNYQPGIPLLAVLMGGVWENCFQTEMLRTEDRLVGWIFGSGAGLLLYPFALGLGNFDPYSLGWGLSTLFALVAIVTAVLIWRGNRFGIVLLLVIVAYDLHFFESPNFWDYLVDPIYWLVSLVMVAKRFLRRRRCEAVLESAMHEPSRESSARGTDDS